MSNIVTTYIEWDSTGRVVKHNWHRYSGTWSLAKGDSTAKASEVAQASFTNTLQQAFTAQFAKQNDLLDFLKGKLQPMIDNPTGYSTQALTAMRTSASDTLSSQYDNAQKALQAKEFTNGSRDLPSGVNDQVLSSLMGAEASDKASAQNNITLADENLKQQNYWNALGVLSGNVTNATNPLGYAGEANQGSGAVAGLSQAVTASNQSQLLGALGGIASGAASVFAPGGSGTKALFG